MVFEKVSLFWSMRAKKILCVKIWLRRKQDMFLHDSTIKTDMLTSTFELVYGKVFEMF